LSFFGDNACITPPPWGSGGSMVVSRGLEASLSWLTRKKDVFSDGCCFWCSGRKSFVVVFIRIFLWL
jgi:hypothetical protein